MSKKKALQRIRSVESRSRNFFLLAVTVLAGCWCICHSTLNVKFEWESICHCVFIISRFHFAKNLFTTKSVTKRNLWKPHSNQVWQYCTNKCLRSIPINVCYPKWAVLSFLWLFSVTNCMCHCILCNVLFFQWWDHA